MKNKYTNSKIVKEENKVYKWSEYIYELERVHILNEHIIRSSLEKFWNDILIPASINDSNITKIYIMFKVSMTIKEPSTEKNDDNRGNYKELHKEKFGGFSEGDNIGNRIKGKIRAISYLQKVGISDVDKENLLEVFNGSWEMKTEDYFSSEINSIIYNYKFISPRSAGQYDETRGDVSTDKNKLIKSKELNYKDIMTTEHLFRFAGVNLPKTMDPTLWGEIFFYSDYTKAIVSKPNSKIKYNISLYSDNSVVYVQSGKNILFKFTDYVNDRNDLSTFTRKIEDNQEYVFQKGECVLKKNIRKTKFLQPTNLAAYRSTKFLTMDLETKQVNNILIPRCISICDGKNEYSFEIMEYNNDCDEMLKAAILFLMKRKYSGYKVYLHNFSYFDGVFLLRILSVLTNEIKPIIKDGRLISVPFHYGKKFEYVIHFRDSLLLLPSSLSKLAKSFNVEKKGHFPHSFVNLEGVKLNYVGCIPEKKYFYNITDSEYLEYCNQYPNGKWDIKKETIKYCEQDVRTLYQIIDKFSERIYNLFRVNITKYPTLSSLSFGIFRSCFLKESKIPLIYGEHYKFLKKGFTGGSVDIYKPSGKMIHRYDVNSLYPFIMKSTPMPVGYPVYFEGDISLTGNIKDLFGFFEVEVQAPSDLKIPFLQTRVKTENGGIRTISALGNWRNVYSNNEIVKGLELNYKFKIFRGYLFEKGDIFSEIIDKLYEIKKNSKTGSPDYIISKFLMNSLYGRFGMNPIMENHIIVNDKDSKIYLENYNITDVLNLNNGKILISYLTNNFENESDFNKDSSLNISVSISAAIAAHARLYMYKFKNMKGYTPYYSDTDSIDLDKKLPDKYVGIELGQMKYENTFKKVAYLSAKCYGAITNDGEIVKIKGLKNPVSYSDLELLLVKDSELEVKQDKWYRNFEKGEVSIYNELYNLKANENKRTFIYDDKNKAIDTRALVLKNGEIITDK
jgi:hypothetical protein